MPAINSFPRADASNDRGEDGLVRSGMALDHALDYFRRIAAMVDFPDPTPDFANDRSEASVSPCDADPLSALDPLTRRAFDAVLAGLAKLAETAAARRDGLHDPPTPDELDACADIGRSMRRLLERAQALLDPVADEDGADGEPSRPLRRA
jgi:hypothetical protein